MSCQRLEVMSHHVFDSGDAANVVTRSRIHGRYKEQDIDLSSTETLVIKKWAGNGKSYIFTGLLVNPHIVRRIRKVASGCLPITSKRFPNLRGKFAF